MIALIGRQCGLSSKGVIVASVQHVAGLRLRKSLWRKRIVLGVKLRSDAAARQHSRFQFHGRFSQIRIS
jgi:hypothetical protein